MIKRQGFTLAEALITLVIISLVMAATMPIVLKSQNAPSEAPFKYVTQGDLVQNAAVYSALGATSTVLFGDKRVPVDSHVTTNKDYVFATKLNPKISVIARSRTSNPLISRHLLDFYEKETTGSYTSIGKVSFDQFFNLSLGANALDSIKSTSDEPQKVSLATATDTNGYDWADLSFSGANLDVTNTKGAANTAIGQYSMGGDARYVGASGSTGSYVDTPTRNLTGIGNTALGAFSMRRLQTGHLNTGIGVYSLQSSSKSAAGTDYTSAQIGSGSYNAAVGAYSLKYNSTGSLNSVIGTFAMRNNSSGEGNTALGYSSLYSNTTGGGNVGIGNQSLLANTTGTRNIAIGMQALNANTTGWNNIVIGYSSGTGNTTGTGNIVIGNGIATAINASNKLYIGGKTTDTGASQYNGTDTLIYGDMSARTLTLNTESTEIGVSDSARTYLRGYGYIKRGSNTYQIATVNDIVNYISNLHFNAASGAITYTSPSTIYSDARLKNIIGDNTAGLKEIMQIQVKNYTMKRDKKKEVLVGVIAQELQKVFPNSVVEGRDGYLRIRRDEIFYACINAIKDLNNMFKDLVAKVTGLEEKIRILEDRNKMNETKIAELERQNKLFEERLAALELKSTKKIDEKVKPAKAEKVDKADKADKSDKVDKTVDKTISADKSDVQAKNEAAAK